MRTNVGLTSSSRGSMLRLKTNRQPRLDARSIMIIHPRATLDRIKANPHHSGVTFRGESHLTLGGVGRNLAAAMELLGHKPIFVTSLADDNLGKFALGEMNKLGFNLESESGAKPRLRIIKADSRSSCFALVLIDSLTGQCEYVIANLDATDAISKDNLANVMSQNNPDCNTSFQEQLDGTPLVVLDANLSQETLAHIIDNCTRARVPIFLEPTDVACLARLATTLKWMRTQRVESLQSLAFLSPNIIELEALLRLFDDDDDDDSNRYASAASNSTRRIEQMADRLMKIHMPYLKCLLVTMDKRGVLVATRGEVNSLDRSMLLQLDKLSGRQLDVNFRYYQPHSVINNPISASGAGDCFAAGFMSGLLRGLSLDDCILFGFKAAACALNDTSTVPLTLRDLIESS